jgi:hypothetical protein
MIPARLISAENEIRQAIARRRYGDVPGRLDDLRRFADAHLADLPAGDALRLEIIQWMLDTIEWARLMVTTQRQVWQGEALLLPRVGRYLSRDVRHDQGVCLDL